MGLSVLPQVWLSGCRGSVWPGSCGFRKGAGIWGKFLEQYIIPLHGQNMAEAQTRFLCSVNRSKKVQTKQPYFTKLLLKRLHVGRRSQVHKHAVFKNYGAKPFPPIGTLSQTRRFSFLRRGRARRRRGVNGKVLHSMTTVRLCVHVCVPPDCGPRELTGYR